MTSRTVAVGTLSLVTSILLTGSASAVPAPAQLSDAAAVPTVPVVFGIPVQTAVWAVVGLIAIVAGLVAASKPARAKVPTVLSVPAEPAAALPVATVTDLESTAPAA